MNNVKYSQKYIQKINEDIRNHFPHLFFIDNTMKNHLVVCHDYYVRSLCPKRY